MARAAGTYILSLVILGSLYMLLLSQGILNSYLNLNAYGTSTILNFLGQPAKTTANIINTPEVDLQMIPECTPLLPAIILIAAMTVGSQHLKEKLYGVLVGFIALSAINFVRTVSLYFVAAHQPQWFDNAHLILWQSLMVVLTIGLWFLWEKGYLQSRYIPWSNP